MTLHDTLQVLGIIVVAAPALLLGVFGILPLVGLVPSERSMGAFVQAAVVSGLVAAVAVLGIMLATGIREVPIELGNWVDIPQEHFHFHIKFVFDRLSVPFTILSFVLCSTVGAFAKIYLHRDSGFSRFFVFYAVFLVGMVVSSLAGTIETLFMGWEFVGLSSALLVAFFQDRPSPVRNGQRVWVVYRIADAAFLIAAITLHHLTGAGDFDAMIGQGAWPEGVASISPFHAFVVGLLLLVAAGGKSGMVPFSGWLPRAMEGPTPSSAIFYGALSVHLGAYLLLRVSPVLAASTPLCVVVIAMGAVSAIYGSLASRVQTDIKSALAFASLTQVGIIVVEIGFGLHYIPLIHMIGHACLRTLQLLRAPSLLKDYQTLENAIGARLSRKDSVWHSLVHAPQRSWLYRFSFERGYLDGLLYEHIARPFLAVFRWSDTMERRWTELLSGEGGRESDQVAAFGSTLEEDVG
ncbi:MAG: oxidoreductase [Planctomycetales bacterium]|nr:oxidoreductase [Planctomycetales bacterium]